MMKQSELVEVIETLLSTKNADNTLLLKNFQLQNCYGTLFTGLAFHKYRFKDGPFKGQFFLSTAAKLEWLNKYNNLRVVFFGGKFDGLETTSLVCFDRKIEKIETQWKNLVRVTQIIKYT